ncbi:serine threonine protein kinase, partial [Nannochloropsis gaditana CCMP526]|uniref:serine threonine protein kinase n=1 Tax=Nannochloropsis gaditana (strain CCMP526) TaxID=1093141 RepID=UPI00029F5CE0
MVMEYMNGGSLQDLVDKGGSRDEALLAKIAYNVLRGLSYLHSQGKIHRDVKPG